MLFLRPVESCAFFALLAAPATATATYCGNGVCVSTRCDTVVIAPFYLLNPAELPQAPLRTGDVLLAASTGCGGPRIAAFCSFYRTKPVPEALMVFKRHFSLCCSIGCFSDCRRTVYFGDISSFIA